MTRLPLSAVALLALTASATAFAAPARIPLQGSLTDVDGQPVSGSLSVAFNLYAADGATVVWSNTKPVQFTDGVFTTYLGENGGLDLGLFADNDALTLGLRLPGDTEMRIAMATVPYAGFAEFAGDAETLNGLTSEDILDSTFTQEEIEDFARAVAYDDPEELTDVLDASYALVGGTGIDIVGNELKVVEADLKSLLDDDYARPDWTSIDNVPSGFADGIDDDTTYTAGVGLLQTSGRFDVDRTAVEGWAEDIATDLDDALRTDLTLTEGDGIEIDSANEISVDQSQIEDWATAVAFDTEEELTDLLDDRYVQVSSGAVTGDLEVTGAFEVGDDLIAGANVDITSNLDVGGDGDILGDLIVGGDLTVEGNAVVEGSLQVGADSSSCSSTIYGTLRLNSSTNFTEVCSPSGWLPVAGSRASNRPVYRYNVFDTHHPAGSWNMQNDSNLYGGINPSNWTDGNAIASSLSTNSDVLRSFLTKEGYGGPNANIVSDVDRYWSSTNGKVVVVLFRIRNTTSSNITWRPYWYYSSYGGWNEYASVATRTTSGWSNQWSTSSSCYDCTTNQSLTMAANTTTMVAFVATTSPSSSDNLRVLTLGFYNNSLTLPTGLVYLDDFDTF